ncbi:hypothetical protein [Halolamina salifodinae]|uniref:Uncharacterized protein n=1 Tax=Halolamina salifodinae TaxID=1202767 RepID=A0A8T4GXP3_9EURY|nr:hypothetical protein [Halolamina salifodinae]MBP1986962.1 hypothetical protein [Halolamina salifodinae]
MSDGKDWERVGLRVHPDQLSRWEAVCTPEDPSKPDDAIVNELPHLYNTKSNLIRTAVSELINRETGELGDDGSAQSAEISADTRAVEEKVDRVYTETREIRDLVEDVKKQQSEVLTEAVRTRDDLVSEVYEVLPRISGSRKEFIEMMEEKVGDVFDLEYTDPHRADELGFWLDVMAYFEDESDGVVLDSLEKLVEDVDEVSKATIDGKRFYFKL